MPKNLPQRKLVKGNVLNVKLFGILTNLLFKASPSTFMEIELRIVLASDGLIYAQIWDAEGVYFGTDLFTYASSSPSLISPENEYFLGEMEGVYTDQRCPLFVGLCVEKMGRYVKSYLFNKVTGEHFTGCLSAKVPVFIKL